MENENQVLVCLSMDAAVDNKAGMQPAPEVVNMFAYGTTDYTNADNQPDKYVFLEADADALMAEFNRRGVDLMMDYNHQQLRAKTNGQPAPASGWITALEKGEKGLSARVSWTDRAKEFITNKEYRYTSPLFYKDKLTNRITRLVNLALTNIPGTDRQQALVGLELRATECDIPDSCLLTSVPINNNLKGGKMSNKKLFELVGLEMPVDADQQLVALEGAINTLVTEKTTLQTENSALKTEVSTLKQKEEAVALEAAITEGLAKGKLNNDTAEKARGKSLQEVLTILELIPENGAVPLNRAPEGKKEEMVALSPEDVDYCVRHGYDQAEFAKAKTK